MSRLTRLLKNEEGIAMATVVCMIAVLTVLGVALIDQVTAESNRSAAAVKSDAVYQAAEAGINDYVAKLTDDPQYYDHCVAKGESTRKRRDNGALVSHSTSTADCASTGSSFWHAGVKWDYPYKKDWWFGGTGSSSGNSTALRGYAYNLMVTPPSSGLGTNYLTIVSTGCQVVNMYASPLQCMATVPQRALEVRIRPMTPADFQYIVPAMKSTDPCYASNIYGTMYSPGNLYTCGAHVWGNLEAENTVNGSYTLMGSTSRVYDVNHPDIRSVVKNPFSILDFGASPSSIKRLAGTNVPTTDFEDSTAAAWRVDFTSNGNVQVWKCIYQSGAPDPASSQPFCGGDLSLSQTYNANTNYTQVNVSSNPAEFPVPDPSSTYKIYVGTGSNVESFTYNSIVNNGNGTWGFKYTSNQKFSHTHSSGDKVSFVSGGSGVTWSVPYYNNVPQIGAIYTGKDAIISWPSTISGFSAISQDGSPTGQVNGRFTLASAQDVVIAGDLHYASEPALDGTGAANDDVLGLISSGDLWLAEYAPNQLWWRAATMALGGNWSDYCAEHSGCDSRTSNSQMTFVGTLAYSGKSTMYSGGDGYDTARVYRIADDGSMTSCPGTAPNCMSFNALKFLVPPSYPVINGMQATTLFHEVSPATTPDPVP